MELEAMIVRIETSYNYIIRLYRSLPAAALLEPALPDGWSVKDLIAHLAAWEWRCIGLLSEAHVSDTPLKANPDVDALNQEIFQERQAWNWEEVEFDFQEAHQALLETIRNLPPKRLQNALIQKTIAEETWEHYEEHLADLEQWRRQATSYNV